MITINEKIEKEIGQCDQRISEIDTAMEKLAEEKENLQLRREKLIEAQNLDLTSLLKDIGAGKKKQEKLIPNGFGKMAVEIAVNLIETTKRPVHTTVIMKELDKKFDYGKPAEQIDYKRKYSTLASSLSNSGVVETIGDRSGMWRKKLTESAKERVGEKVRKIIKRR